MDIIIFWKNLIEHTRRIQIHPEHTDVKFKNIYIILEDCELISDIILYAGRNYGNSKRI